MEMHFILCALSNQAWIALMLHESMLDSDIAQVGIAREFAFFPIVVNFY